MVAAGDVSWLLTRRSWGPGPGDIRDRRMFGTGGCLGPNDQALNRRELPSALDLYIHAYFARGRPFLSTYDT